MRAQRERRLRRRTTYKSARAFPFPSALQIKMDRGRKNSPARGLSQTRARACMRASTATEVFVYIYVSPRLLRFLVVLRGPGFIYAMGKWSYKGELDSRGLLVTVNVALKCEGYALICEGIGGCRVNDWRILAIQVCPEMEGTGYRSHVTHRRSKIFNLTEITNFLIKTMGARTTSRPKLVESLSPPLYLIQTTRKGGFQE